MLITGVATLSFSKIALIMRAELLLESRPSTWEADCFINWAS